MPSPERESSRTMSSPSQMEPSWCRITTGNKAEETFRFTIDNFKDRPEKCKEKLTSTPFTMKGPGDLKTKWQLEINPKGKDESSEDFVSVYLNTKSDSKITASYKVNVIDGAGKERNPYYSPLNVYNIAGNFGWGNKIWLKRDELDRNLLPDGNLTIKCTVTVFGPEKILSGSDLDSSKPNLSVNCQKQIADQLGKLFSNKQLTDV